MHVSRPCLFVLACLLYAASISAQSTSSLVTSDPQAVALLQKSLASLTNGVQVSDVTLTGSVRRVAGSDDETGTFTLTALSTGNSKASFDFPSGARVEIRNPATASSGAAGVWSGADGTMHIMAAHNLLTDGTWFFPAFTLASILSSQNDLLAYRGVENHNGQSVLHVSVWAQFPQPETSSTTNGTPSGTAVNPLLQHLSQMDVFFDPSSSLPVALDFTEHPDNDASIDIAIEIRFSNYQSTNGVLVPMHFQKYLNNSLALDLQITNAAFNSGLASSAFAIQ